MPLTQFNQIIDEINSFYFNENACNYHRGIFVLSKHVAMQVSDCASKKTFYKIKISIFCYNMIEFLKSHIKSRVSEYKRVIIVALAYDGLASIELTYGSAVVVRKTFVDKFYFKDVAYFDFLYTNIPFLQSIAARSFAHGLMIRQSKYHALETQCSDIDILRSLSKMLLQWNDSVPFNIKTHRYFSVCYKVEQMFDLYLRNKNEMTPYLNICVILEKHTDLFYKKLCHGDFWKGNILKDISGQFVAIDFDKMIYFCAYYDFVYFYLMNRVLPKVHLEKILIEIDKYADDMRQFFLLKCRVQAEIPPVLELKSCIFLFVFIKLLERDLHENNCGNHVNFLKEAINKYSRELSTNLNL